MVVKKARRVWAHQIRIINERIKSGKLDIKKRRFETVQKCSIDGVEKDILDSRLAKSVILEHVNNICEKTILYTPFGKFDREVGAFIF